MNSQHSTTHITALFLLSVFVVTVYVSENAFEKVSRAAQRQAYQQAAALELSADAQCIPAGPGKCTGSNKPGKDQCPCKEAQSGSPGLCVSGKCKGFGNAGQTAGEAMASQMGQGLMQGLMQMLQQMMQGGGGGGGGGGSGYQAPIEVAQTPTVLDTAGTSPLTNIGELNGIDLAFGTGGTGAGTTPQTQTNTPTNTGTGTTGQTDEGSEGSEDSITTRYETLGAVGENADAQTDGFIEARGEDDGAGEFVDELNGAGLEDDGFVFGADDSLNPGGLTQDELELLALEAFARQGAQGNTQAENLNLPYGQLSPEEVRRLQTLGYSTVSGELNPLSGFGGTGEAVVEAESQGVLSSIVSFFRRIFGFGAPQQ